MDMLRPVFNQHDRSEVVPPNRDFEHLKEMGMENAMAVPRSSEELDVYFEPAHYAPDEIEAVLSDGTHLKAVYQLDGRRLGFDRALPVGTLILLGGVRGWVVGSPNPGVPAQLPIIAT